MTPSAAIDQLARQPDGSHVAVWGKYLLRSAFQPIFAFGRGRMDIVAFEGLIRPFDGGAPVPPGIFFGSIGPMDRFGVETLTRNLHVLNSTLRMEGQTQLFLNFDPSVFVDRAISDAALRDLRVALSRSGIDPSRVVCELTEHKSGSEETLFDFVSSLKANGFKIALDDYGADESDYSRVKALGPDIIKFDGGWISRLMESQAGAALLKAMVTTFSDMGIKSLFEGLEETWQLDLAHECGVEMVQGFILAMPELVTATASPQALPLVAPVARPDRIMTETMTDIPETESRYLPVRSLRPVRAFGKRGATQ